MGVAGGWGSKVNASMSVLPSVLNEFQRSHGKSVVFSCDEKQRQPSSSSLHPRGPFAGAKLCENPNASRNLYHWRLAPSALGLNG